MSVVWLVVAKNISEGNSLPLLVKVDLPKIVAVRGNQFKICSSNTF